MNFSAIIRGVHGLCQPTKPGQTHPKNPKLCVGFRAVKTGRAVRAGRLARLIIGLGP